MSKILANQIANYGDNSPVEVKEGVNIPADKPLQADGVAGSVGQILSSTGTSIEWIDNFSGSYNDLTDKPTIPNPQIQSDWNATSGIGVILNKPIVPPQPSVSVANASGSGNLAYNQTNGNFTFTPADLSPYALTTALANSNNWNTAYSWGDHAQAGYATAAREGDWDAAYSWGDHALVGYLTFESDTLQTVTLRGATTSTKIIANGGIRADIVGVGGGTGDGDVILTHNDGTSNSGLTHTNTSGSFTISSVSDLNIVGGSDLTTNGEVVISNGAQGERLRTSSTGIDITGDLSVSGTTDIPVGSLGDVDLTIAPVDGQVLKWNAASSSWKPANDLQGNQENGIAFADLAVTVLPTGTANLTYNGTSGVFTYTPPDLSSYLTTESDPVFSASVASGIIQQNVNNWNDAHGWGNHATAGYATTTQLNTALANSSDWDTAYGWGDHSTQGYIAPDANDNVTLGDTVPQSWDTWANTWGRFGYEDYARGSCVDSSENIYVISETRSPNNWPYEGLFSKFNSNGDLIFSRKISASTLLFANPEVRLIQAQPWTGPALDEARSCVYVIVEPDFAEYSSHLVKLSTDSGNVLWARSIGDGTSANDPNLAATINVDPSNGNVVFAYRGHKAYAFDTDGNLLWSKDFTHVTEGSTGEYNTQLIPDGNGNYYYIYDDCIEKLTTTTTPLDTSLWSKKYVPTTGTFDPHVVELDSNGDLILCDWFGSKIKKISKVDGSIIWQKVLSSGVYFEYTSIDSDDNIYLAGDTYNFGTWIYKIDTNGNLIKRKKIQGSEWYGSTGDASIEASHDFPSHISVVNGNLYISYSYYAYLGSGDGYNCGLLKTKSSLDSTTDLTYRSLIRRESPITVSDFDPLVDYFEVDDNYTDDTDTVTTIDGFIIVDHTFTLNTIAYLSTESKGVSFDKFSGSWKKDLVSSNIIESKVLKVDEAVVNRMWMGGLYFGNTSVDSFSIVANTLGKGSEFLTDSEGDSYDYVYYGYSNVILGPDAATGTTGYFANSIIVGSSSGFNNRGSDNIFLGRTSGVRNETGANNIYVGQSSARSIGSGSFNIALGPFSGSSENQYGNVALDKGNGSYNINLGYFSGAGNITGNHNISSGQDSLRYNKSGIGNIALGYKAMQQTSSKNGFAYTNISTNPRSASYNIAIGYQAASLLGSEATHQIVLGNVESPNPTAIGQLAIGVDTAGTDNYWLTGDSSFNVNISQRLTAGSLVAGGLTYPTSYGAVGQVLTSNGSGGVTWATPTGGGGGGANVTISDTAPGSPDPGDLWWESDKGRLKIYYNDTDSQQWVDASPPLAAPNSPLAIGYITLNGSSPTWSGTAGYTVAHSGGGGLDEVYTLTFPVAYSSRTDYIVHATYDGTNWITGNGAQLGVVRNAGNVAITVRRWNEDPLNQGEIMITITNL